MTIQYNVLYYLYLLSYLDDILDDMDGMALDGLC
jgi:hypothetical protein